MAAILNSAVILDSAIFHSKTLWLKLIQSDSNSFILTQLDDGSHLEFYPSWIQPFFTKLWLTLIQSAQKLIHSQLNFMMEAILNSAILD